MIHGFDNIMLSWERIFANNVPMQVCAALISVTGRFHLTVAMLQIEIKDLRIMAAGDMIGWSVLTEEVKKHCCTLHDVRNCRLRGNRSGSVMEKKNRAAQPPRTFSHFTSVHFSMLSIALSDDADQP